ncbi:MAG: PAS domain-containing protein [Shimia sp.]
MDESGRERTTRDDSQAHRTFDDSPQRFRDRNPEDAFDGASGVLFEQAMGQTRMAICLSDPHQEDAPIVFANRAFRELTGYSEDEILGRNCRFLQGPGTDPAKVAEVRRAIEREDVIVVELLNYRKDGTPFWNALHLGPIYDAEDRLIYLFGSQWDVTDVHAARAEERHAKLMSRELSHRVKNMFAVIGGIVNITGRTRGIREEAREINERIQALGRAYETTLDGAMQGAIEVGAAVRTVLAPYDPDADRFRIEDGVVVADPALVSTLGLTLHELATNAIKYGALSKDGGTVTVSIAPQDDDGVRLTWIERDGPPVTPPASEKGSGIEIVDTLLAASGSRMERDWHPSGLRATVHMRPKR